MRFREYPLLNTPNMVVVVLREAATGATTLDACALSLRQLLDRADEHPPFGPEDVASRLETVVGYLDEAKLIVATENGGFRITDRGAAALRDHPSGLDTADLMHYPEFAAYIRALEARRSEATATPAGGYDQGFYAYWTGETPADNPYPPDSADHLAWENGWSEALDEDDRWPGPRHSPPKG